MKKCTTSVLTVLALLACQPAHAGTVIQRHLLPKNLRSAVQQAVNQAVEKAVNEEVAGAANHQEASPRHVQQNRRRVRNEEQQHYGVSARAVQRKQR